MTAEVHVAFAVDSTYLRQATVTIASIVANASEPEALRFYIVHDEEAALVAEQVAAWTLPNVTAVKAENSFAEVGEHTHVSKAAFLKTRLPEVLTELDRVIYLDADTLVLGNIRDLWNVDLGGCAMGGVLDFGVYIHMIRATMRGDPERRNCMALIGLDPERPEYVNSGVLLMDLKRLREMNFSDKIREMDEAYRGQLMFVDQDVINSVMRGRMKLLDPRWNVVTNIWSNSGRRRHHYMSGFFLEQLASQANGQWLLHWAGRGKPWNSHTVWRSAEWWAYAARAGLNWPEPKPSRTRPAARLLEVLLELRALLSRLQYRMRKWWSSFR